MLPSEDKSYYYHQLLPVFHLIAIMQNYCSCKTVSDQYGPHFDEYRKVHDYCDNSHGFFYQCVYHGTFADHCDGKQPSITLQSSLRNSTP